ncbi:acylneuraminate cytidylyltransferase [Winogradskyella sp. J14-2]|uniref:acylneuraminate cytidylyltransferase family protein n=1 Tax=Winogradskyella sp. J14-2 TaxID=1936080 RepID=UPI0009728A8D|nr:acylneuraminate cytidylyltransferase family protein [Winogradskyella sp. J14-2]APY07544.1 acylneuraminate cytidylyltransferase [Winogradskyella sp. J14-2]
MSNVLKNVVAIIPARGGSKRLANKNILPFGSIPLIAHSIKYAQHYNIKHIYVSTDDAQIKTIAKDYGAKIIDRPKALALDDSTTVSVLKHALEFLKEQFTDVILLQPTNPLRPKSLLKDAYSIYTQNNLTSLFTVSRDYKKLGKINNGNFIPFNYTFGQRSQDLEPLYYENGLLYITSKELIKRDIIFDETSYPLEVNHKFAEVDIDTLEDLEYAKYILNTYNDK